MFEVEAFLLLKTVIYASKLLVSSKRNNAEIGHYGQKLFHHHLPVQQSLIRHKSVEIHPRA